MRCFEGKGRGRSSKAFKASVQRRMGGKMLAEETEELLRTYLRVI